MQEHHKLEASLGYIVRPCLKKKKEERKGWKERGREGRKKKKGEKRDFFSYVF
jgi:hypothetical protein